MRKAHDFNMNGPAALDRIRIVLSHPSHPGNIGGAARAMKTMGLSRLVLVNPAKFPDPVADARASGAGDLLAAAQVVGSLQEALAGTVAAAALTARRRELMLPRQDARAAAGQVAEWAGQGEVALVFGNETSGLSNEELALCTLPVTIPTDPGFSSLNLAAAVQIVCYELRLACGGGQVSAAAESVPASFDEVEGFHAHLERVMVEVDFFDPANPRRLLPRLRRLFSRVRLEREEVAILRGILTAVERKNQVK
jgi:tRNA/rRNA methyltransferase